MPNSIIVGEESYVIDSFRTNITLADSFVKNKCGTGHGEAKLYVGNEGEDLAKFFGGFNYPCFFLKSDFSQYVAQAEPEFLRPTQPYVKRRDMPRRIEELKATVAGLPNDRLDFNIERRDVDPPRVYIASDSPYFDLLRGLGLPNYSFVSIMKVRDSGQGRHLYFRMFLDYSVEPTPDILLDHQGPGVVEEYQITTRRRRDFQERYRAALLDEFYSICPITRVNDSRLLIACHIMPVNLMPEQAHNPKNGIVLTPTYHKLFDDGLITFSDDGRIVISPWLSPQNAKWLGLVEGRILPTLPMDADRQYFMKMHREQIFNA